MNIYKPASIHVIDDYFYPEPIIEVVEKQKSLNSSIDMEDLQDPNFDFNEPFIKLDYSIDDLG